MNAKLQEPGQTLVGNSTCIDHMRVNPHHDCIPSALPYLAIKLLPYQEPAALLEQQALLQQKVAEQLSSHSSASSHLVLTV